MPIAWVFPRSGASLFAVATGLGFGFYTSSGGLFFARWLLLASLFGTVFAAVLMPR